jgi:hypothetical protein
MISKFLDFDPFSGIEQTFHYDPNNDTFAIEYKHKDVGPQLDCAQALANDPDYTRDGMKREWLHYAHIPAIVQLQWLYEKKVDLFNKNDQKKVWQFVNDPEYRKLKTTHLYHEPKR